MPPRQILSTFRYQGLRSFLKHSFHPLRFTMAAAMDLVRALKVFPFPLMVLLAPGVGPGLRAQDVATLQVDENLRAEPRGAIIGRLLRGSSFPVVARGELWVQVQVEGWMWLPSLQVTDRGGFDLSVSAAPTENLRAEPQGDVVATLAQGALLWEVEEITGWRRVRRNAWVWVESVALESGSSSSIPTGPSPVQGEPEEGEGWWRSGADASPLLSVPDGDTLARAHPGVEFQVVAREGNWVRVKFEGWTWAPLGEVPDTTVVSAVADLSPDEVGLNPTSHRGRVVSWDLQFVSLERAEKVRTDFYEGEPFLLARTSSSGSSFVYVAVPPERLEEVEGLIPLERINVVGRIRTGAAAFTGNPILDLLELTRLSRD